MKYLKKTTLIGGAVAGALLLSSQAFAQPVTVDGINFSDGANLQIGSIYENAVSQVGDGLSGYGRVDSINGETSFCAGGVGSCELTFQFDGYTVSDIGASQASFDNGTVNFYADTNPNFDANSNASAGDGALFLSTAGHEFTDSGTGRQGTLLAQGANLNTTDAQGTGVGQLDVTGGDAATYFDTNTQSDFQGGFSDLLFNSSFSPCDGSFDADLCGSADLHSNVGAAPVPEPSQLGLMGLGLVALGFLFGRRRRSL